MIYQFECPGDGEVIEIEFPITAVPQNVRCSTCGAELKRVFNAPSIHFKGKGFYSTDK